MSSPHPPELADYRYSHSIPVFWGDQDAFGHVNNTVYFRWMEIARIEYFEWARLNELMAQAGIGPILASIKCDFRRQLKYPDTVLVSGKVTSMGGASIKMTHLIYSQTQQAVVAEGDSVIVAFDYQAQRPVRIPDSIRARIDSMEGRSAAT
jgi:acyl-CoA thioester hydrolase